MTVDILLAILRGIPTTLGLTALALLIGAVGGVPLALMRRSRLRVLRLPARTLIELLRGVPPIVWLFVIFFGLAPMGILLDPFLAAVIGLGVISCAYLAEIYRGGLAAIHGGQHEAAAALGMSRVDAMTRVVGPQVLRISIPATATYGIGLIKDTSIAFTIGVEDMMYFANSEARFSSDALGPYILVAVIYIVLSLVCAWGARSLDRTLRKRVAR